MITIWRYDLPVSDVVEVEMPRAANVLPHVAGGPHPDIVTIWAVVVTDSPIVTHRFRIVGTGNPVEAVMPPISVSGFNYVGTAVCARFVWHVFDGGAA